MKAKKIEAYKDKWFTTIVYLYRGKTYEVTYPNGSSVCCTPAYIQHRDEQEKIDKLLDSPAEETETIPFWDQFCDCYDKYLT